MKKQKIIFSILIVILLGCIGIFFRPLSLSDKINDNYQMSIVYQEVGVRNREPLINSVDYSSIAEAQENAILDLMKQYPYRRTFGTPFSDGSTTDMGDTMLLFSVQNDTLTANSFIISSSGKIVINNKNYRMKNAKHFIEQVIEIMH